ncbi:hypothetical protein ILYODFUR_028198 [Ilyodon furcidens]|uniref:B30.2/SPRY domain-containing protein n=1 Tax=Ilyodon furcidens TaxID=33524 RepID=A0ABV0UXC4_9TELE
MITTREKQAVAEAEELQLQLKEEITKMRKRKDDLQKLSLTSDHVHFIQTFPALSTSCESPDLPPGAVVRPRESMETAPQFMGKLKDDIEHLLEDFLPKFSAKVSAVNVLLPPVPKSREQFLLYSRILTLDVNTVNSYLAISEEQRRVTYKTNCQYYSSHSDRFGSMQVLCREALSERCYWEVHWKGSFCAIAVAYKDICRSSNGSEFGFNDKSWSLECSKDTGTYTFRHRYETKTLSGPLSFCVGVYLDYKAGTLAFYSISEKMTLLHTEQTTFSQPLYPGFGLKCSAYNTQGYVELVKLW